MNLHKSILLALCLLCSGLLFGQETNKSSGVSSVPPNNGFRFSLGKMVTSTLQFNYERALFKKKSAIVFSGNLSAGVNNSQNRFGFGSELMYKFYFNPIQHLPVKRPNKGFSHFYGLYFGPFAMASQNRIEQRFTIWNQQTMLTENFEETADFFTWGGGFMLGAQWAFGNRLLLDLGVGGIGRYAQKTSGGELGIDPNLFQPHFSGITPKFSFQFGFAF